jgi:hypothetical protein
MGLLRSQTLETWHHGEKSVRGIDHQPTKDDLDPGVAATFHQCLDYGSARLHTSPPPAHRFHYADQIRSPDPVSDGNASQGPRAWYATQNGCKW